MVDYLPRSAWGARAPKPGPGPLDPSRVEGAVIHWPGTTSSTPITSQEAVASALRNWQAYHMDTRGWSDIAYQVAVDQAGRAWTLRGLRTQSGANGNNAANEAYGAILLVLVQGEQPSEAMEATVRAVVADFRRIFPRGVLLRPHSEVRLEYTGDGTDCPGPAATAALKRGEFTPIAAAPGGTPPPPTGDEVFDMTVTKDDLTAALDGVAAKYISGDNDHDAQVLCWQVAAQSFSDARYAELVGKGVTPRDALVQVKDDLWPILRPLWS